MDIPHVQYYAPHLTDGASYQNVFLKAGTAITHVCIIRGYASEKYTAYCSILACNDWHKLDACLKRANFDVNRYLLRYR